jgi:tetratricopeptide (TPR) repeat protein
MRQLVLAVMVMAGVAPARADERADEAKRLYEAAKVHFQLHELDKAAEEFAASFKLRPDPVLLYNLAQTHRQARHFDQALYFYRQFLASDVKISPKQRQEVRDKIAELEQTIEQQQRAQTSPPDGPDRPTDTAPAATPAPTPAAPVAPALTVTAPAPWYRSVPAWVLLGTGVAAVGVGGGLLAHGNDLDNQIPKASSLAQANQLASDRDAYRRTGIALLAIGGAAAVAGGVVFGIAGARHKTARAYVAPSLGGVLMGGVF